MQCTAGRFGLVDGRFSGSLKILARYLGTWVGERARTRTVAFLRLLLWAQRYRRGLGRAELRRSIRGSRRRSLSHSARCFPLVGVRTGGFLGTQQEVMSRHAFGFIYCK